MMNQLPDTPDSVLPSRLIEHQQAAIASLGTRALAGASMGELLQNAVEVLSSALNVEFCMVLEYDPGASQLTMRAGKGWQDGLVNSYTLSAKEPDGEALLASGSIILSDLARNQKLANISLFKEHEVVSGASVKIFGLSHPYGIVGVYSTTHRIFNDEDINFLQSIANLLAAAIYRNQAHDSLKKLTTHLEEELAARARLVQLLQDVTIAANQAETIAEAMQIALDLIINYTGWPLGHVFYRSTGPKDELLPTQIWSIKDPSRFQNFRRKTAEIHISSGVGLPGKVLATGEVVLRRQVARSEPDLARNEQALQDGIVDGLALPVMAGKDIVAVMEFYTDYPMGINLSLIEALENIGTQLGRVVERRQAEEKIRTSQRQLAEAQRVARIGSWEWDLRTNQVNWSAELYRIYGLDPQAVESSFDSFLDLVHIDDRPRVQQTILDVIKQNQSSFEFIYRIVRPNTEVRSLRASGQVIIRDKDNAILKMIGTSQDITEQIQAEEKVRAGEELLRRVVTAAPIILWSTDRDGRMTLLEGRGLSILGLTARQLIGERADDFLKNRPDILEHIHRALDGEEIITIQSSDEGAFEVRYAPVYNEQGEVTGMLGVSLDITERVRMESALRISEARFRTIFEGSAVGKAIIDLQRKIVVTNEAMQSILGYPADELEGRDFFQLILPMDYQNNIQVYNDFFLEGKKILQLEQRLLHKEKRIIWSSCTFSWMRKENGELWFAIVMAEDITPRKQIEAELSEVNKQLVVSREKERLSLAQELHDEPLQELYGLMYQLSDFTKYIQEPEGLNELQSAQTVVGRLIDSLRGICRELRPPALAPFGLEGAIREYAERFQEEHPEIHLDMDMMNDSQILPEHVRLTLFRIVQQALSNIVRHAQATQVTIRFRFDSSQILLEVEDNGKGFAVPKRWVSLVRDGHLGLAGAAERVETVDGKFHVDSAPGRGTTIQVVVPRLAAVEVVPIQQSRSNGVH
jgi:PAS domain S-box-containing protein